MSHPHTHTLQAADLQQLSALEFARRFKVVSKLGQGAFADVLRVRHTAAAGAPDAALKVLKPGPKKPSAAAAGEAAGAPLDAAGKAAGGAARVPPEVLLFREARALKHAQHPNVVQLHCVMRMPRSCLQEGSMGRSSRHTSGRSHETCWGLLQEYLQGGSLAQAVHVVMANPHAKGYSASDALTWSIDIASALAHLHGLDPVVIHRDLKLENVLLTGACSTGGSAGAGNGSSSRRLPMAKLTDFGLHVMIERPPVPFMISTADDGSPMLIFNPLPEQQQQQQQQQGAGSCSSPRSSRALVAEQHVGAGRAAAAAADSSMSHAELLEGGPAMMASDDSKSSTDALARVAAPGAVCVPEKAATLLPVLKGHAPAPGGVPGSPQGASCKHVHFMGPTAEAAEAHDGSGCSMGSGCCSEQVAAPPLASAAAVAAADAAAGGVATSGPGSTSSEQRQPQPQHPRQWQRLTAGTLRRLSLEATSRPNTADFAAVDTSWAAAAAGAGGGSGSGLGRGSTSSLRQDKSGPVAIPLLLEQSRQSGSFVEPAFPAGSLPKEEEGSAAAVMAAALAAGSVTEPHAGAEAAAAAAAAAAGPALVHQGQDGPGGDVGAILAAANSDRDIMVHLKPASLRLHRSSQTSTHSDGKPRRLSNGSLAGAAAAAATASASGTLLQLTTPLARSSNSSSGAGDASGVPGGGGGTGPPSLSSKSAHSSEWPTAASMIWEDITDDKEAQEQALLLDALPPIGFPGLRTESQAQLPLAYGLTGHTGSYMYMAPEVFQNKPYNESADVFSLGVIIYELLSRSLLLYTHTPATKPDDCVRYASKVAQGFRPKQPKPIPANVWAVIEACWKQEPSERPSAAWVLQELQVLAEEAAAAKRAASGSGSALGRLLRRSSGGGSTSGAGTPTAGGGTGQGAQAVRRVPPGSACVTDAAVAADVAAAGGAAAGPAPAGVALDASRAAPPDGASVATQSPHSSKAAGAGKAGQDDASPLSPGCSCVIC